MKTEFLRRLALSLTALTLLETALRADPADLPAPAKLDGSYVTIPYTELHALWEAGRAAKDAAAKVETPPPVPYVIDQVDCQVRIGAAATTIDATYEVQSLAAKWERIPLMAGNAHLVSAESKEGRIIWSDGYVMLTDHPVKADVVLHLAAKAADSLRGKDGLHLSLPAASVKRLTVTNVPDGEEALVNGLPAAEAKEGVASFSLSGDAGDAVLTLIHREAAQPEQPSHWQIESQTFARYADGRLHFANDVFARTTDGSGARITLYLPPNASEIAVTGEDLGDWRTASAPDGRRLLEVPWKTRNVFDRELRVSYVLPQSPLAAQWNLFAPTLDGNDGGKAFFVIAPGEGMELQGNGVKSALESRRLPQWIRDALAGNAFWSAEGASPFAVAIRWLPEIPTAEATVTEASCAVRLVADGSTRTQATYAIAHGAPLAWKLELPAKVQLLSCEVDKKPGHALQRPDGAMEIELEGPRNGGSVVSNVTVVYASASKALDPIAGEVSLSLPRTELFIEKLNWNISLPAIYEPTAVNANLSSAPAAPSEGHDERIIALRKDLCRGETPTAEIYYQRLETNK